MKTYALEVACTHEYANNIISKTILAREHEDGSFCVDAFPLAVETNRAIAAQVGLAIACGEMAGEIPTILGCFDWVCWRAEEIDLTSKSLPRYK